MVVLSVLRPAASRGLLSCARAALSSTKQTSKMVAPSVQTVHKRNMAMTAFATKPLTELDQTFAVHPLIDVEQRPKTVDMRQGDKVCEIFK